MVKIKLRVCLVDSFCSYDDDDDDDDDDGYLLIAPKMFFYKIIFLMEIWIFAKFLLIFFGLWA